MSDAEDQYLEHVCRQLAELLHEEHQTPGGVDTICATLVAKAQVKLKLHATNQQLARAVEDLLVRVPNLGRGVDELVQDARRRARLRNAALEAASDHDEFFQILLAPGPEGETVEEMVWRQTAEMSALRQRDIDRSIQRNQSAAKRSLLVFAVLAAIAIVVTGVVLQLWLLTVLLVVVFAGGCALAFWSRDPYAP